MLYLGYFFISFDEITFRTEILTWRVAVIFSEKLLIQFQDILLFYIFLLSYNYEPWKWIYILYGDNRSIKNSLQQWIFRRSYSFYTTKHILLTPLLREISKVNLSIEVLEQNDIIIVFGSISLPTYISNFKTRMKEKYWT